MEGMNGLPLLVFGWGLGRLVELPCHDYFCSGKACSSLRGEYSAKSGACPDNYGNEVSSRVADYTKPHAHMWSDADLYCISGRPRL